MVNVRGLYGRHQYYSFEGKAQFPKRLASEHTEKTQSLEQVARSMGKRLRMLEEDLLRDHMDGCEYELNHHYEPSL